MNAPQRKKRNLLISALLVCTGSVVSTSPAKAYQAVDPFMQNPNLAVIVYSDATRFINDCYINRNAGSCYQVNYMKNALLNSCQQWGGQSCISYNLVNQMDNNARMNQGVRNMYGQY